MTNETKIRWLVVKKITKENFGTISHPNFQTVRTRINPVLQVFINGNWIKVETEIETDDTSEK